MNRIITIIIWMSFSIAVFAQDKQDSTNTYKKRVLETAEIDMLTSFYTQDGDNAAVTGGIGTEKLNDFATNINISIPLNDDDVLSIDGTISAYSSASSSNLNPFSGASSGGDDDDDDDDDDHRHNSRDNGGPTTGSPWIESSGASKSDIWGSASLGYSHSSDDRNSIYKANVSFAAEYDYTSIGGGVGLTKLFNSKNTELTIGANLYLDQWNPQYPTEIKTFVDHNGSLYSGFFNGVSILDQNGNEINKSGSYKWEPLNANLIENKNRNTYSLSISFSQILSKRAQISIFSDITYQEGWLANPMQRVYFSDIDNFYIGNASNIPNYTNPENGDVFQLADDIERLPDTRMKFPIGTRLNVYINQFLVINTYYRYYFDDWGLHSNTINIELPVKVGFKFTLYPSYRFYNQTAADYFAPFEQHLSTQKYYTSDYDLSKFNSSQIGLGIKYTDIFTENKVWYFGLKNISLDYSYYQRTNGLKAHIISLGAKVIFDK